MKRNIEKTIAEYENEYMSENNANENGNAQFHGTDFYGLMDLTKKQKGYMCPTTLMFNSCEYGFMVGYAAAKREAREQ